MPRILITSASVVACIATLAVIILQRRELASLRQQEQRLRAQPIESTASVAAPNQVSSSPEQSTPSIELLRLRGEVGQLERRKRELISVRPENDRLRTQLASKGTNAPKGFVLPAGYIKKSEARFSGYGTPEDTIQSLLWAIQNRDTPIFLQLFTPELARRMEAEINRRGSPEEFFKEMNALPGLRIIEKNQQIDGTILLNVETLPGDETHSERMCLKQVGGQWKLLSGF